MTVLKLIRDCLDALLHPSARHDALSGARHRAFMAPRLVGCLAAFAAFPVYLALQGAPDALEVGAFAWLIARPRSTSVIVMQQFASVSMSNLFGQELL